MVAVDRIQTGYDRCAILLFAANPQNHNSCTVTDILKAPITFLVSNIERRPLRCALGLVGYFPACYLRISRSLAAHVACLAVSSPIILCVSLHAVKPLRFSTSSRLQDFRLSTANIKVSLPTVAPHGRLQSSPSFFKASPGDRTGGSRPELHRYFPIPTSGNLLRTPISPVFPL